MQVNEIRKKSIEMIVRHIRMITWFGAILRLLMPLPAGSQSSLPPAVSKELVYVHLDRQVYVTGESMQYRVYAVDAARPGQQICSKILYFTLSGVNDKTEVNWRINLLDNPVHGSFEIPSGLKSGMYVLTAYTNWMRNDNENAFCSQNLLIMNLSEPIPGTLGIFGRGEITGAPDDSMARNVNMLKIRAVSGSYTTGELARVEIYLDMETQQPLSADVSISVVAESPFRDLLEQKDIASSLLHAESDGIRGISAATRDNSGLARGGNNTIPCLHRMEDKGFILTGSVKRRTDKAPLIAGELLLSVIDSTAPSILYARTDSAGKFLFYLSRRYDNTELILQLGDPSKSREYTCELDKKTIVASPRATVPYSLQPDKEAFLSTVKNIRLIDAIYMDQRMGNKPETYPTGVNYFSPPDAVIYPAEYADMVNFKEMADNILPVVKFTLRNNVFYLQLLKTESSLWEEVNMVLLNGVPFTDLAYISTLGTKDIKRIEVITSTFLLGDLTFPGLISIYTHDNKIPATYLKGNAVTFQNAVMPIGTGSETAKEGTDISGAHYPDFRNTLYWKPDIVLTPRAPLVVEFPVSRLTGTFIVKVQGIISGGIPVSAETSFEVKD